MPPSDHAQALNAQGNDLREQGRLDDAADAYRQAVALAPGWAVARYNLGLVRKQQRRWPESLEHNRRAATLDPSNEAAWWNMGIAATACGRWELARQAWRGFGIDIPDGDGPIEFPCGVGPVRLNPDGAAEVVWGQRLDPARMAVLSVPLPDSGHCWGDLVLNDGEPVGTRLHGGVEVPVFNALALLLASEYGTFVAQVRLPPDEVLMRQLAEQAQARGGAAEDWSSNLQVLCRACSEGRPHEEHEREVPEGARLIGLAAHDREHAEAILEEWAAGREEVVVEWVEVGLERRRGEGE